LDDLKKSLGSARHVALVKFLVAKRQRAGLSQQELARQIGQYQSFVARLESGQRRIDTVELVELAEVLKFDPAQAIRAIWKIR
jgi:transcriptional regulator with XRE-family HTH domain